MRARALRLFEAKESIESIEKQPAIWEAFKVDMAKRFKKQARAVKRRQGKGERKPKQKSKGMYRLIYVYPRVLKFMATFIG